MNMQAMSDRAILRELGGRLRRARLERNLSQRLVAERAGLSRVTVGKLERGIPSSLLTLIQFMRALGLLDELEAFLPDPGPSPLELARRRGQPRRRASREAAPGTTSSTKKEPEW